jgi:predicted dehydrogenase
MSRRTTRRDFLKQSTAAGLGFWALAGTTAEARQAGPNERLNVAIIGAGGQGGGNLANLERTGQVNIVALCDADERRARDAFNRLPQVPRFNDFRVMLERQRNIDAVAVSTPDHTHAAASVMAMRMGKHCYCEKPLTHDIHEARVMRQVAAERRVATQMGNHGTSGGTFRRAVEVIQAGALGPVREVHVWTNRPGTYWRQGMQRPKDTPAVPQGLHWDIWLGPAPERPYHGAYVPFAWRGWWDFGTGAIGDMACHTMNLPYMALRLDRPTSVVAESSTAVQNESPPNGCKITYEFPARGDLPPVRMIWYEVGRPPEALFRGQRVTSSGSLIIGERGTMYSPDDYGGSYRLLPEADFRDYRAPAETLPRSPGHHREWVDACRGGRPAMSNFDYAARLTETALLGNVALRVSTRQEVDGREVFIGRITWDAQNMRATGTPQADQYIRREYRRGWAL